MFYLSIITAYIEYGNSVHMTIIFNVFVLYSLFNQINSRIIDDSFNILKKIYENYLFISVMIIEFICQYCIVQYGGVIFKCSIYGLTRNQWLMCVGCASITFLVSIILKLFNVDKMVKNCNESGFIMKYLCCCFIKKQSDMFEQFIDEDENGPYKSSNAANNEISSKRYLDVEMKKI